MADNDDRDAVELASAYLDGEATADERARVESDAALLAEVERLRRVRDAVAEIPPAPVGRPRERRSPPPWPRSTSCPPTGRARRASQRRRPSNRHVPRPLARQMRTDAGPHGRGRGSGAGRRWLRDRQPRRRRRRFDGGRQRRRRSPRRAIATPAEATQSAATAPTPAAAADDDRRSASEPDDAAGDSEAADEPMAAAPSGDAGGGVGDRCRRSTRRRRRVPTGRSRDADDLADVRRGAGRRPAGGRRRRRRLRTSGSDARRRVRGRRRGDVDVVVATTADGYAAVSLDDCAIVLRAAT